MRMPVLGAVLVAGAWAAAPRLAAQTASSPGQRRPSLENDSVRVEVDPRTGGLVSIRDKRLDREYVAAPDRAMLFRLIAPEGERRAASLDAGDVRIEAEQSSLTLRYRLDGVQATAGLRLDGEAIVATLEIDNRGSRVIEETIFPWVRGLSPLPEASLVCPFFFGRRIDAPFGGGLDGDHRTWNELGQKRTYRYPGHLATAWHDYGDRSGGLAIEGRHADFSIMDFYVHKVVEKDREPIRRTLDVAAVQPRRVRPGERWRSAPVRIVVHTGDWHAVADAHREWLETWVRKPERPARFAEAIGWHFFFLKHQDGLVVHTYDDLPKLAEASLAAGCPYLLVFGWQTGGHDNNYLYRYVPNEQWGGAARLREAIAKSRALGAEIIPFFNGTLANVEMPEHKQFGQRWEARTRAGHPYYAGNWARHNTDAPTRNREMLHHEICPCDEHRDYFLATVRRITGDYGFGNIQLDQISEKMFPCYEESHRHTFPDRAFVDGLAELLPRTRQLVREAHPGGVMIGEWINDFTAQWCDSSWSWKQTEYPEPVLYTLPWVMMSHEIDALEYGEVNKAFAYRLHLDLKIDGGDSPITRYPAFAAHVKKLAELRRRVREHYVYADFRDQEGVEIMAPRSVMCKTYLHRAMKKGGVVVAEIGGEAASIVLEGRWLRNMGSARVESSSGDTGESVLNAPVRLELRPFEVKVLCLDLE